MREQDTESESWQTYHLSKQWSNWHGVCDMRTPTWNVKPWWLEFKQLALVSNLPFLAAFHRSPEQ